MRTTTPAEPWQRRVFNGRAQVLVESTGEQGVGTLMAIVDGLRTGTARIEASTERVEKAGREGAQASFARPVVLAEDEARLSPDPSAQDVF